MTKGRLYECRIFSQSLLEFEYLILHISKGEVTPQPSLSPYPFFVLDNKRNRERKSSKFQKNARWKQEGRKKGKG